MSEVIRKYFKPSDSHLSCKVYLFGAPVLALDYFAGKEFTCSVLDASRVSRRFLDDEIRRFSLYSVYNFDGFLTLDMKEVKEELF